MNVKVFVDTNVLVYSRDISEVRKQAKAMQWMTRLWETRQHEGHQSIPGGSRTVGALGMTHHFSLV